MGIEDLSDILFIVGTSKPFFIPSWFIDVKNISPAPLSSTLFAQVMRSMFTKSLPVDLVI